MIPIPSLGPEGNAIAAVEKLLHSQDVAVVSEAALDVRDVIDDGLERERQVLFQGGLVKQLVVLDPQQHRELRVAAIRVGEGSQSNKLHALK